MLKLTKKVEYALIALRHMHQKGLECISSAKEIAEEYKVPYEILAKTLQQLARNQVVNAIQGPKGGYKINPGIDQMNLVQFIEMMEGPTGLVDCQIKDDCLRFDTCNIRIPIANINRNVRRLLQNISLADILIQESISCNDPE